MALLKGRPWAGLLIDIFEDRDVSINPGDISPFS